MIGDTHQAACTFNHFEADSLRKAKLQVIKAFTEDERALGVIFGDLTFYEAEHPKDGPMIVGEATVVRMAPSSTRIIHQLHPKELEALRAATRRAHQRANPGAERLTDQECDAVIDQQAPKTLEAMVKRAVENGARVQ